MRLKYGKKKRIVDLKSNRAVSVAGEETNKRVEEVGGGMRTKKEIECMLNLITERVRSNTDWLEVYRNVNSIDKFCFSKNLIGLKRNWFSKFQGILLEYFPFSISLTTKTLCSIRNFEKEGWKSNITRIRMRTSQMRPYMRRKLCMKKTKEDIKMQRRLTFIDCSSANPNEHRRWIISQRKFDRNLCIRLNS